MGANVAHEQKEDILCQIETEPAQGTRGSNQDRDQDRESEKEKALVVEKGLRVAAEAVRAPAEAWAAARGQANKTLRINKTDITVK
jgi:hypothetical protein